MSATKGWVLVTGGAGFIGSALVDRLLRDGRSVVVLDALTYAGDTRNLEEAAHSPNYRFIQGRIEDPVVVDRIFSEYPLEAVLNLAAESHVDRSIESPEDFLQTNVVGTFRLLKRSLAYWESLPTERKARFRYLQISTDEVFGELGETGLFDEESSYAPNSPYSASKAAADHFVRAWHETYGLPTIVTNCSNNYGPRQYAEKLIPFMIARALAGKSLGVYGDGKNVRDWIHVEDHCAGIALALEQGKPGERYCFGGNCERRNIDLVRELCALLDELAPRASGKYAELITFVTDRKGHDYRYAIDSGKALAELGYAPKYTFASGLRETVEWYVKNTSRLG